MTTMIVFCLSYEKGETWWKAKDVAEILGYKQPDRAIRDHVKEDEKRVIHTGRFTRYENECSNAKTYEINESGLYRLIFSSKLPTAEVFRKWVIKEVLPSIRKTGEYSVKHHQLSIRSETDLHYEVVKEIRKRFPQLMLIIPGGELQDTKEKRIDMWKKGFKGGQPDIMIMNPHVTYNGLCIELKNPGGTGVLSEKQKDILERYNDIGWKTIVCDDLVTTVLEILEYTKGVRELCKLCKKKKKMFKSILTLSIHTRLFHRIKTL